MEKKGIGLAVGLLVVLALIVTPVIAQAQAKPGVIQWRGQMCYGSTTAPYGPFGQGQTGAGAHGWMWADWVKKASNGRLIITWAEPGAIFPIGEADNAVSKGVVQIASSFATYYAGRMPEADVETGGVFQWENNEQAYECVTKYGLMQALQKVYAKRNMMWLPFFGNAIIGMGANFAAPNPAAIKGKKIRAIGNWADYIRMLGGSPIATVWGDIYMAMKMGTIDGYVAGPGTFEELKLKEVTKSYVYPPLISAGLSNFTINLDAWKALPADLQELLERDTPAITYAYGTNWFNQHWWMLKMAAKNYGVRLYAWPQEDVNELTQRVIDEIYPRTAAKSPDTAMLLEIVKKQMRDYGRIK